MSTIKMRSFTSVFDFLYRWASIGLDPTVLIAYLRTDAKTRERIQTTITLVNNCQA